MNKRGQVFLVAALIIVGIVLSIIRIFNEGTAREEPESFFDLGEEISFETKRVLDYGIINESANVGALASELLNKYSENIAKNDVAFVYGDAERTSLYAYYYNRTEIAAVSVYGTSTRINVVTGSQIEINHSVQDKKATIKINGVDYAFDLKPGQNFYFVIAKDEEGEKFVTVE